jgi:hypothetical protein
MELGKQDNVYGSMLALLNIIFLTGFTGYSGFILL